MKNMLRLFNLMMVVGVILLIGTAGASDCGLIGLSKMLWQGGSALMLIIFAMVGKKFVMTHKKRSRLRTKPVKLSYAA